MSAKLEVSYNEGQWSEVGEFNTYLEAVQVVAAYVAAVAESLLVVDKQRAAFVVAHPKAKTLASDLCADGVDVWVDADTVTTGGWWPQVHVADSPEEALCIANTMDDAAVRVRQGVAAVAQKFYQSHSAYPDVIQLLKTSMQGGTLFEVRIK